MTLEDLINYLKEIDELKEKIIMETDAKKIDFYKRALQRLLNTEINPNGNE